MAPSKNDSQFGEYTPMFLSIDIISITRGLELHAKLTIFVTRSIEAMRFIHMPIPLVISGDFPSTILYQSKIMRNKFTFTLLLAAVGFCAPVLAQKQMKFNADGTFKIVQITDTHIKLRAGKSETVFALIDEMIRTEKPDLVVFTGDIVTERKPQTTWERLFSQMAESGTAWTIVFGNHDSGFGMTNDEIYELAAATRGVVIEKGPAEVKGTGNFTLELLSHQGHKPANIIYFMDSHDRAEGTKDYAWIDRSQIGWYRAQSSKYHGGRNAESPRNGTKIPAIAFFHIPLPEFAEAACGNIIGVKNERVYSPRFNSGLFAAMQEEGDICGIFVGHDHDNDFIANHKGIALAYGRFSGGGSTYGDLPRGARVIILSEGARSFETYIRLAGGEMINRCRFPEDFSCAFEQCRQNILR